MSKSILISHNPFTIETKFTVDGKLQDDESSLHKYVNKRLQEWIEEFFPELYNIYTGEKSFDVTFQGVKADYLDLCAAAEEAKKYDINAKITWQESKDSPERLADIQKLMEEAKNHEIFKDKIKNNPEIQENFQKAFNRDFDVYVAATMSAGKSTLINAMLGCDLLPAANEATTATIAQITDNDSMKLGHFKGSRINKNNEVVENLDEVSLELLKQWNSQADTKLIQLEGNILGIQERENVRLVITDTPGPNNSQDDEHSKVTIGHIKNTDRNPLIIYILNGTQLGTNDDKQTLGLIAEIMSKGGKQSKDRFIFVVNKMDSFDPEKGEDIKKVLQNVRNYLEENGIQDPKIFPVSAYLTRLLRLQENNPDSLTRSERGSLRTFEELFIEEPSMNLVQYMNLTATAKDNLNKKGYSNVMKRSGLPAIEAMIDEYIDKYSLPERVTRAKDALTKAIELSSDEAKLNENLAKYQDESEAIKEQLKALRKSQDDTAMVRAKVENMINNEQIIDNSHSINEIAMNEAKVREYFRKMGDNFEGLVDVSTANARINALKSEVKFQADVITNSLTKIVEDIQKEAKGKLSDVFNQHIKELFSQLQGVPLPILQGLESQLRESAMVNNLGLSLENNEVQSVKVGTKRVKTGTERVKVGERSTSTWYKPWTWGDTENIYETRDVYGDQDVYGNRVDLANVWEKRSDEIFNYFNELSRSAREKIQNDVKELSEEFLNFMEFEFNKKLDELTKDLEAKTKSKAETERLAEDAKSKLKQIAQFKQKLDSVLAL